jgi:hypothetical protein
LLQLRHTRQGRQRACTIGNEKQGAMHNLKINEPKVDDVPNAPIKPLLNNDNVSIPDISDKGFNKPDPFKK